MRDRSSASSLFARVFLTARVFLAVLLFAAPAAYAGPSARPLAHATRPAHPLVQAARSALAGEVLVAIDDGAPLAVFRGVPSSSAALLAAVLERHALAFGDEIARIGNVRFMRLRSTRPDFDPARAAADLAATGAIKAAIPDLRLRLFDTIPNDPDLPLQWYVDDGGYADVRLPAAWDTERGAASVRIGIMDTGVDMTHPDLASQIWTNPGEIPGNGVDDDGNGYVDDIHGWDFGGGDNDPNPHAAIDSTSGLDVGFHGTFVAAIAAAATDNSEGIAGAGWNCRIVPLKVTAPNGDITTEAVTAAFAYAAAQHLEVLNMSLGTADAPGVKDYFQALVDAATSAGVLCVASAGNDGTNALNYPAACDGVLAVGATDASNARSSFSNYGPWVRIAAPGETMFSAICQNYVIDDISQIFYLFFFGWDGVSPYMYGDGTSFSAPLAAGVCALVRAEHPSWSPSQVESAVITSGDVVTFDQPIGPKLNAAAAVLQTLDVRGFAPSGALALSAAPNPSRGAVELSFTLPRAGVADLGVLDLQGRAIRSLARGELSAGEHRASWDGRDALGRVCPPGLYWARLREGGVERVMKVLRLE